jgi:hypothetical protein
MSAVADEGRGNAWVATPVRGDQDPPALRAELARIDAEAARDQRERNDPGTHGMVEARDHQAAGGRFDDADATQRLIDAARQRNETVRAADAANARAGESLWRSGRAIERAQREPVQGPTAPRAMDHVADGITRREEDAAAAADRSDYRAPLQGHDDRGPRTVVDIERAERERAEVRAREDRETDARHAVQRFPFWHNDGQQERGPTDRPGVIERAHAPRRMQGQTRDRGHVWVSDRARRAGRDYPPITRGRGLDEERQR